MHFQGILSFNNFMNYPFIFDTFENGATFFEIPMFDSQFDNIAGSEMFLVATEIH